MTVMVVPTKCNENCVKLLSKANESSLHTLHGLIILFDVIFNFIQWFVDQVFVFLQAVFTLIVFRPFVGEIIAAKLIESNADGIRCMSSRCFCVMLIIEYQAEGSFIHDIRILILILYWQYLLDSLMTFIYLWIFFLIHATLSLIQ